MMSVIVVGAFCAGIVVNALWRWLVIGTTEVK